MDRYILHILYNCFFSMKGKYLFEMTLKFSANRENVNLPITTIHVFPQECIFIYQFCIIIFHT